MTDFDPSTFASVDAQQFAKIVRGTSDAKIDEVMRGDVRDKILDEVFSRFPATFRPERAGTTNATIHWVITGRPDGGEDRYEVVISGGTCTVSDTPIGEPKLTITLSPLDFMRLLSGGANPMMMFMTGKLKAKGDLGLAANIANLFDMPKA